MGNEIFWCGAGLNFKGLKAYSGETPAATQWSRGLLTGLQANGIGVHGFAPVWDTLWPKGRLFPGDQEALDPQIPQRLVPYANLPYLRSTLVAASLEHRIDQRIRQGHRPAAILNYNPYPHYCKALSRIARKYPDIPWVNVVLDLDDPTVDDWLAYRTHTRRASGAVFLSWWGYTHAPDAHKLHLDGGWQEPLPTLSGSSEKVFIYAGKFAAYGGIDELIDAIRTYPAPDVFFDFYGKDRYDRLEQLAAEDPRVRLRGFVTDEVLASACSSALAFLNPRDLHFHGTKMVFPSKLLFYLKFRKPVIGPMMPGLSPDYDPLLVKPADAGPAAWAAAMEHVRTQPPGASEDLARACTRLLGQKTWTHQAARLWQFIQTLQP